MHKVMARTLVATGAFLLAVGGAAAQDERAKRPAVRDVTPPGINRIYGTPQAVGTFLESAKRFDNVRLMPDGTLRSGEVVVRLHAVVFPERRKLCTSDDGARWACGLSAVGALRGLVHGKSMLCRAIQDNPQEFTGVCRVGSVDVSARLLEQGWAQLSPGTAEKEYVEAEKTAKAQGKGIWGGGPAAAR